MISESKALPASKKKSIRMGGCVKYSLAFDTVTMKVAKIEHDYTSSGTLKLVLWMANIYTGSDQWSGHQIAEARLETLGENEYYYEVSKTVSRKSCPPGNYAVILALEAYSDGSYIMHDHIGFDIRQDIIREAELVGTCGFTIEGDSVELRAEKIRHNMSGATGTLKLVLWASSNGVSNGSWSGYQVAKSKIDPLEEGMVYTNIKRKATKKSIPAGCYYIILQLKSYTANGWIAHNHLAFDGTTNVK